MEKFTEKTAPMNIDKYKQQFISNEMTVSNKTPYNNATKI